MNFLFGLFVFSLIFSSTLSDSTSCDPLKGVGTFNPGCTSTGSPYCVNTVVTPPAYECSECVSSCDCGDDDYCSSQPGQVGTCQSFSKAGSSCRPLQQSQISNTDFPDDWKCAITYSSNTNPLTNTTGLTIDIMGVCDAGTCRYCDPRGGSNQSPFLLSCGVSSGLSGERTCVYPGYFTATHSANWTPGNYYENPDLVWWAIFFCLLVLLLAVQIVMLIFTIRKRE